MALYKNLIDIHNHSIPYLDDGAKDIDTAVEMLRLAEAEGISEIILTPHYHGGHVENSLDKTARRYEELKQAAVNNNIDINLHLGNEIYYYPSICEWLRNGIVRSMAESDYVLVEFGNSATLRDVNQAINNIASEGYIPVIAHIERYEAFVSKKENIKEAIRMGALVQMNAEAVIGTAGIRAKHIAKWALKNECVHFIGTDSHSLGHRKPNLQEAAEYIASKYSVDYMEHLLIDNPKCIINNDDL